MIQKIFNPFRFIAGWKALLLGLVIIIATAFVASFSNTHFPDPVSVKIGQSAPFLYYLLQSIANWLVLSCILFIMAKLSSGSSIRIIDVFGTQALARLPYFFASFTGFATVLVKFSNYLLWVTLKKGNDIVISNFEIFAAILLLIITLFSTIWLVVLSYNAFYVSTNLKGFKSIIIYVVSLLISVIITSLFSHYLFSTI